MYKDIFANGYVPNYTRWVYHGEHHRIREEVVRPQLEEFDADAGTLGHLGGGSGTHPHSRVGLGSNKVGALGHLGTTHRAR
jgi:hypothetical protein